ncbi:MAG: Rieske 2Fe-2S domain-containing protein [Thiobacillaceae bacterium]|nr:Rieske 2Fe-2S domain-containing protein [Thiobacillaceae bacterium]
MAAGKRLICAPEELQEAGLGVRFEVERDGERLPAFAIRFGGSVRAYLNRCGHIPVELDFTPGVFFDPERLYLLCSLHGALYDPASGACVSGRCNGRGLTPLPVIECEDGIYLLDEA